jgi:type I restriction-modification system DNA methylase subunit
MPTSKDIIEGLVSRFRADMVQMCASSSNYTETAARIEFIDPLFSCLGWDMSNSSGLPNSMKDVLREESQQVEAAAKRPDYTFRIAAHRKFFLEAKKPSVDIRTNKASAFQVRSYGWTVGLNISVLTNFRTLRIYDTRIEPSANDSADVGLLLEVEYNDLSDRFEELLTILGREAVATGSIETHFGFRSGQTIPINDVFLSKINTWRLRLAKDLHSRYTSLCLDELNDLAQKVINRIIFVRMCEDRGIEGEERLRQVAEKRSYVELCKFFKEMDDRYNTGLFAVNNDPLQKNYTIDAQIFLEIVEELYFPNSPYSFSVLDADFLGQVYELFLVKRLEYNGCNELILVDKPAYEDREVITTPQPLVDELVRRTISGKFEGIRNSGTLSFDTLRGLRVLDIAVGSGRFLLSSLDEFFEAAIHYFRTIGDCTYVYRKSEGDYRLQFQAKRQLLESCMYGIDIDYNAVEVARFSLLVKLLEDENKETLPAGKKILPNLDQNIVWGNSVVGPDFIPPSKSVEEAVRPFDWCNTMLPAAFDIIVGNPPYVKTEDMKAKTVDEYRYYQRKYSTPYKQFDKYFIFIEKAISKLTDGAWLGMVVPNKWMTIEAGYKLRVLLTSLGLVSEIVDFGNERLFEGRENYVCLLVISKQDRNKIWYRNVTDYSNWLTRPSEKGMELSYDWLQKYWFKSGEAWVLPSNEVEAQVLSVLYSNAVRLGEIADINNGIQTSAERIYSITKWEEYQGRIRFKRGKETWEIEKAITKPYLIDSTSRVWSYLPIKSDALIIFPYLVKASGVVAPMPPEQIQSEFPLAWRYLKAYEERLMRRDVSPEPEPGIFYQYGRHQALTTAFKANKIVYSVNQLGDKYGIDELGVGFASGGTAGEVAITNPRDGYSIEFILALLNQRVIEYFLRKRGSPFGGGYYSRGSAVVADLPVPKLDFKEPKQCAVHKEITTLVREIIQTKKDADSVVGRKAESLDAKYNKLKAELEKQFAHIWDFGGKERLLRLPGE